MVTNLNPIAWNWTQWKSAGRNAASYVAGGVSVAVTFHLLAPAQGTDVVSYFNMIMEGSEKIVTGICGIIAVIGPIYTMLRAAHAASPAAQAASITTEVPGTKVLTSPAIAAAVPSADVISNASNRVVPK